MKTIAEQILEKVDSGEVKGVYASTAAIQEIVFWLYNRQLLKESTVAVNVLSHLRNIEWVPLTTDVCLTASLLINEYKISPFDAYHAATAMTRDKTVLSTEHVYGRIKGLVKIEPLNFAENL